MLNDMSDELYDAIEESINKPKRVVVDGNSAEQFSPKEKMDAARELESRRAVRSRTRGFQLGKFKAPGADE